MTNLTLPYDRFFSPDPITRSLALDLYEQAAALPIISPHGHVDPRLFADPNATFFPTGDGPGMRLIIAPSGAFSAPISSSSAARRAVSGWRMH